MLTTYRESYKTLVETERHDGIPLGYLIDVVINPDNGIFAAMWIQSLEDKVLLLPKDIVFWTHEHIIINDENDLATPEKLPRLSNMLHKECAIINAPVYNQTEGGLIGKVHDFTFDTISPRLLSIEVKYGLLGLKRRIIPHHKIKKITPEGIFITEPTTKIKTEPEELEDLKEVPKIDYKQRIDKN